MPRLLPGLAAMVTLGTAVVFGWTATRPEHRATTAWVRAAPSVSPSVASSPPAVKLRIRPAPGDLPVIDYTHVPPGFPADTESTSTGPLTEGLRARSRLALYDAPGGRPRAFLPRSISGVPVTVPIVRREDGWLAVLLPSADRRIAWLAPAASASRKALRDQVVVDLSDHRLTWTRNGVPKGSWTVATGATETPTPLGRTFVLGHTVTDSPVYAGLDAIVLGAVPENKQALAEGLRGGHTAIHSWYRPSVFGHSVSNGCVRVPRGAQRHLLASIPTGTPVIVVA